MKERGILFRAEMVRAILAGQKTQTRRMVKWDALTESNYSNSWLPKQGHSAGAASVYFYNHTNDNETRAIKCPYGKVGDRLWVRETFGQLQDEDGAGYVYRANIQDTEKDFIRQPWKPSLFMPRAASRITLEITDISVERLNDISEADAIAEGVEKWPDGNFRAYGKHAGKYKRAVDSYASLWESINGEGSWDLNPWTWAIAFKML